ncbi:MAG TPA: glycosyltransferase family 2 protein [Pyrinomonadaceae bacterium]|nr:glycosyltransferase family 2 protein [Pyrinomonadaceae bacterium]
MLDQITPIILTYNEAPNIGRTLERLAWARDVVVVDSFSDDETLRIVSSFSQARVYQRSFDNFAAQWEFALRQTGIETEWVLGLDADLVLTPELIDELKSLQPPQDTHGYRAPITYCVHGKSLRYSLLPPLPVLYRRNVASYCADAHTYRVELAGEVARLRAPILHDDRKPLRRWFQSQQQYMELEASKILTAPPGKLNFADRIRRLRIVAPPAVFCYCLIKGGVLDGWAGLYYAAQRSVVELLLSLYLLEHDLRLKETRRVESPNEDLSSATPLAVATKSVDAAR